MLATAKLVGYPLGATNWSIIFNPTSGSYINPKPSTGDLSNEYIFEFSEEIKGRFIVYFFQDWSEFKDYTTYETTLKDGYTYEFGATNLKAEIPPSTLPPPPTPIGWALAISSPIVPSDAVSWAIQFKSKDYSIPPEGGVRGIPIGEYFVFPVYASYTPGEWLLSWYNSAGRTLPLEHPDGWTFVVESTLQPSSIYSFIYVPIDLSPFHYNSEDYVYVLRTSWEESWNVSTPDSEYS